MQKCCHLNESFQWKSNSNDEFLSTCVCKLESRMLITITNSNSSPEVNSSEVSLKLQCEFCVCTQKLPKHLLGGGAYMTFHECLPWESFVHYLHKPFNRSVEFRVHCVVWVCWLSTLGWKGLMTYLTKSFVIFLCDYWPKSDGIFSKMQIISYSFKFLKHI